MNFKFSAFTTTILTLAFGTMLDISNYEGKKSRIDAFFGVQAAEAAYMEDYFENGSVIALNNIVKGQRVNLHFLQKGGMINSSNSDDNDPDQKFVIVRKPGTNIVKLIRKDSNYLISISKIGEQALLESWTDVGGFDPHQSWYVEVANTPGSFYLRSVKDPNYTMNLPFGQFNRKLNLTKFNPNDNDTKFSVKVFSKGGPIVIIPPPITTTPASYIRPVSCYTSQRPGGSFSHASFAAFDMGCGWSKPVVKATRAGTIVYARYRDNMYGNVVTIRHDDGRLTLHLHLSQINVREGDKVSQGQNIANVGNTGNAKDGTHLHIEFQNANGSQDWATAKARDW
jgi:hypothetical protein